MEWREAVDCERTQPAPDALALDPCERLPADELAFLQRHAKPSPASYGLWSGADAGPIEITFLHATGVDGAVTGVGDAVRFARFAQGLIDMHGVFLRHIELVAQFADIADAHGQCRGIADLDVSRGKEGKGVVGDIVVADRLRTPRARGPHKLMVA